jgi:hypothetical protein
MSRSAVRCTVLSSSVVDLLTTSTDSAGGNADPAGSVGQDGNFNN